MSADESRDKVKNLFDMMLGEKKSSPQAVDAAPTMEAKLNAAAGQVAAAAVAAGSASDATLEELVRQHVKQLLQQEIQAQVKSQLSAAPAAEASRQPARLEQRLAPEKIKAVETQTQELVDTAGKSEGHYKEEPLENPAWLAKVARMEEFDFDSRSRVEMGTQIAEEMRALRTNLWSLRLKENVKTIAITSCRHNEGKTTMTANLGRFFGKNRNRRILVVDCDMRRPKIKDLMNLKINYGFDDVLEGRCELWESIVYSEKDNLYAIPTLRGHSNASELLELPMLDPILKALRNTFDYVIFDTPPLLSTTDPSVLGRKLDGVTIAVKANDTQRESVEHAYQLLTQVRAKVLGIILTHVREYLPRYLYRYQYYHDYYQYYYYYQGSRSEGGDA